MGILNKEEVRKSGVIYHGGSISPVLGSFVNQERMGKGWCRDGLSVN